MGKAAPAASSRSRVYKLLAVGSSVKRVASVVGISTQAVHKHKAALVACGALKVISARGAPVLCEKGPRAADFEAAESASTDRGGRSPAWPGVRAHHWRWAWSYRHGPTREPLWSKESVASGVVSYFLTWEMGGELWTIRDYRGKKKRTLHVVPPPRMVFSAEQVEGAEAAMARAVAGVFRDFARDCGYDLVGSMRQVHPTEWAAPSVPGLKPVGRPGVDLVWVDESEGEGMGEPETRDKSVAATWADLPASMRSLDSLRERVEVQAAESLALRGIIERIVTVQESTSANVRGLLSTVGPVRVGEEEDDGRMYG